MPGGGTEQREEGGNHQSSEGHNCSRNAAVVSRLGRGAKVGGQSSAGGHRAAPAPVQPPPQGSPRPRAAPRWGTVGRSPSVGRAWKRNEPEGESAAVLSVVGPSPVSGGGSQLWGVRGGGRAHSSSAATAGSSPGDGRTDGQLCVLGLKAATEGVLGGWVRGCPRLHPSLCNRSGGDGGGGGAGLRCGPVNIQHVKK